MNTLQSLSVGRADLEQQRNSNRIVFVPLFERINVDNIQNEELKRHDSGGWLFCP